jgi:Lon protease-like protein
MQRELPPRPNLEHLKKQAKDLLDAHQRRDPDALARIRTAVPSFAAMSDDDLARAPFALHDAQSAIAREHGLKSWNELREAVASAPPIDEPPPDEILRSFPDAVGAAWKEAWTRRAAEPAGDPGVPGALPLVAVRNGLFAPRALGPIQVKRSRAAVEAALARTPPTLAIFAQRAAETDQVEVALLHAVGCEAIVHARIPDEDRAWVILQGVQWISLESIEQSPEGYAIAHVAPVRLEPGEPGEVSALAGALRSTARTLASTLPYAARTLARIDALGPEALADAVVTTLPIPVEEKARYAGELRLVERLRLAGALAEARLAT